LSAQDDDIFIFFPSGLNITNAQHYITVPRDSLASIASRFYGESNSIFFPLIAAANNLGNLDNLRCGEDLLIPNLNENLDDPYARSALAATMNAAAIYYEVCRKRSLSVLLKNAASQLLPEYEKPGFEDTLPTPSSEEASQPEAPAIPGKTENETPAEPETTKVTISPAQLVPFFITPAKVPAQKEEDAAKSPQKKAATETPPAPKESPVSKPEAEQQSKSDRFGPPSWWPHK
jgi:hypothetical protein